MDEPLDIDFEPAWKSKRSQGDPRSVRHLTFSCQGRLPLFHRAQTRDAFVVALLAAAEGGAIRLHAWVVMPEHVHLLLTEGAVPLAEAMARLKACFARETLRLWRVERPDAVNRLTAADGKPRFWLTGGGHDRWMRSEDDWREKAVYVEANPVRRGLVKRPGDWKWSSAWRGPR